VGAGRTEVRDVAGRPPSEVTGHEQGGGADETAGGLTSSEEGCIDELKKSLWAVGNFSPRRFQ
jgi:hypothetical protein